MLTRAGKPDVDLMAIVRAPRQDTHLLGSLDTLDRPRHGVGELHGYGTQRELPETITGGFETTLTSIPASSAQRCGLEP